MITGVTRTRAQAKAAYDRLSPFYDFISGNFEFKYIGQTLRNLNPAAGEALLEIGCGTGRCLTVMAAAAGEQGRVCGLDLSTGMLAVSRRRLDKAGLSRQVKLTCGDALNLPYPNAQFDAVFASFTLELFDTPEIPRVLAEASRVLKPNGRVGVAAMSKAAGSGPLPRLYERLHQVFPQWVDCRPIFVEQAIQAAGFSVQFCQRAALLGLPLEMVVAAKPAQ